MKKFVFATLLIIYITFPSFAEMDTIQISVTFGKCHFYSVQSSEYFKWDGNLQVINGEILSIYHLTYSKWNDILFGPSREYAKKLSRPEWKSEIVPNSGEALEGIRFTLTGNKSTRIVLNLTPIKIEFTLEELLEKEFLEYHTGRKYSGQPVDIFLGPDARTRVTRKAYLAMIDKEKRPGWIILPDDFTGKKINFCTKYSSVIDPGKESTADFNIRNYESRNQENCDIRLQFMAAIKDSTNNYNVTNKWMEYEIKIGGMTQKVKQFYTNFRGVQKLVDSYINIPYKELKEYNNKIRIKNLDSNTSLLVFRVYINEPFPSHKNNLTKLPPLPKNPSITIGYDANTLAPQSGEIDTLINREFSEKIGNYILFRPEVQHMPSNEDYFRWTEILKKYNIKAALMGTPDSYEDSLYKVELKQNYLGIHRHECSNLIYGWGEPDPLEKRKDRTLPECKEYYMKRMKNTKVLGQALPIFHMDYEAGVNFVFCEPAGHATLLLAGSRGAAKAYNKKTWGMHVANHILLDPNDKAMERRQFILINQGWLYGAGVIYDEEAALYAIHDSPHSFSDSLPYNRRKQYQELFHIASNTNLGEEIVKIGFLQGLYDCPVGGVQANPYTKRTKFWGMIGPEKPSWTFDSPERGWELLSDFMPGVWLYPVLQDTKNIRFMIGSSPYGQVDLVPINGLLYNLNKYELLILPGWNTMTDNIYNNLIEYVRNGGHLILSAVQCTKHITRDFLEEKKDFNFYNNGDLSKLAGIKVGKTAVKINSAKWFDAKKCNLFGTPSLEVKLNGAQSLITDEYNNPVLIENKIGKGKVWMLTVGEYWGADSLDSLRKQVNSRLINLHRQKYFITGEIEDIDYHIYKNSDGKIRIVFLNTDWTIAGNIKRINLNCDNFTIPLEIPEGKVTHVLLEKHFAVIFNTPSTIIDNLKILDKEATFTTGSVDISNIEIFSKDKIKKIAVDNKSISISGEPTEKIAMDFGPKWNKKNFIIHFE